MKKILILVLLVIFSASMLLIGISCKTDLTPIEEEIPEEEAIEEEIPEEETIEEEIPEEEALEEIVLEYWGWGAHVDTINDEAGPAFKELYPNVTVEGISMGPWDLMDKFYASMVSGEGLPDCAQLVRRVSQKYLISELLYDFTDFMNENEGLFEDSLNKDVTSPDGKVLAIALDYGPAVIYYNKELADTLGVDVSKIVTWEDYYNVAVEVSNSNPDIFVQPLYYPGGSWGSNYWRLWAQSAGANIYDDDNLVIRENDKIKEVTEFFYKLNNDINIIEAPVNDPSIYDALREGKLLFWPKNSYESGQLAQQVPELEGKMYAFPWPLWSEDSAAYTGNWGGVGLVVPKKGPNAEMAAEFLKFLSTDETALSGLWFTTSGVPAYKPVREKLPEMTDRETFVRDLIEAIVVRDVGPWNYIDWAQTEKILGDNLDAMMVENLTPSEMWDKTEEQLIKILGR